MYDLRDSNIQYKCSFLVFLVLKMIQEDSFGGVNYGLCIPTDATNLSIADFFPTVFLDLAIILKAGPFCYPARKPNSPSGLVTVLSGYHMRPIPI